MLAAMDRFFPAEVDWTHPEGGLFLWGTLPKHLSAAEVLKVAIERKVAFVPGDPFHPNGGGHNTMRINFSFSRPEMIMEGIQRLGEVIHERIGNPVKVG
jgi:2-aminoadipate transaminase